MPVPVATTLKVTPLPAQTVDARLIGLGGLHLGRSGSLTRYNAAYRAVPERKEQGLGGKFTIPIPLGLIKFFHDHPISKLDKDPLFHPDSAGFNPVETLNLILNPPLFYEIRKAPTPTNEWHHLGPHVMVVYPDKAMLAGLPTKPSTNGPYVMWADTPYAHVMWPVK